MDFDGLLVDLKVNIFDYLPHNDLKNASLACKSWHEEIFNSARLLRKFKLSIGYDRVFEAFHYKTEREEMYRRDVLVFLRRYGHVFQYIKMVGVFTMDEFKDLLRLIPNVIQLKLNNVNITTEPKKSYYDRIYFPNINKLVLKGCSNTWKVTNFLKNAQVKELHIDKWTTGKMKPDKQYMDWLHRRYRLEHLEVIDREWGSALRLFRDIQFDYVQFKLKTFFIRCPEFSIPENNYLLRFLQHQNELEKVVLSAGYMVFTSKIFQHIFYELNDLNSVEILILFQNVVPDVIFNTTFRSNENVKTFKYTDESFDDNQFRIEMFNITIQIFPCLVKLDLEINKLDGSMFQFLSERLESLQTLKIGWMDAGNYTQTKFKSLTELSIDGCSMTDEDWTLFLAQNPQIEKLSLDNFVVDSYSVEAIIKNGANLKHLQMNSGFYPTDLLQIILEHKKLLSVTLRPETMEHFEDELAKEHNIDFKTGREDRLSFYHNKYEYFENVCEENPELWNNFDEHYRELH